MKFAISAALLGLMTLSSMAQASFDPRSLDLTEIETACINHPCYLDKQTLEVADVVYFAFRFYADNESNAIAMVKFNKVTNEVIWKSVFARWYWDSADSHVIDSLQLNADQTKLLVPMTVTTEDDSVTRWNFALDVQNGSL